MDKTKIAVSLFDKLAKEYQDKFMNVDLYSESFDLFCSVVNKNNATILELACGPGNISKYLLKKRPDLTLFGIDLAPNMVLLAEQNNPTAKFSVMDCRNIATLNEKFDAVMCGFCLPYVSKTETISLIHDAINLLTHEGVIYISTMEDDNTKSRLVKGSTGDEIFMNFHESAYLKEALKENGMEIIFEDRKKYPGSDGNEVVDLILIAKLEKNV